MILVDSILQNSGVQYELAEGSTPGSRIYLSQGNQLLGTYRSLKSFRANNYEAYGEGETQRTWEAHHIFEDRELDYLGVRKMFPNKENCLCVLIPADAHKRLNSIFASHTRRFTSISEIINGYRLAHSILGNYSGASPGVISGELDKIVRAAFRCANLLV